MDAGQLEALLLISMTPGLGPVLTRRALEALGSAEALVQAGVHQLAQVEGIGLVRAQAIRRDMDELAHSGAAARESQRMAGAGARAVVLGQPGYPKLLEHIPDPPPLLYVRGELRDTDALALAIVGARSCTHYGREQADRIAGVAVQAGLTIVSGGAYGIDAAAHRAALRAGGRTLAVLGSGLDQPYPQEHRELFDQIAAGGGAVLSELPMAAPPVAENFPRRNRIISGLSLGVLVVEASLRSGALITARLAAEEHHREVMALPGRVDSAASAGCHKIIREGWATLVTNAADVLDALGETGSMLKVAMTRDGKLGDDGREPDAASAGGSLFEQNLTASQAKIVQALAEPRSLDQLAAATALPVHVIQADLTMLQIRSLVTRGLDGTIRRRK